MATWPRGKYMSEGTHAPSLLGSRTVFGDERAVGVIGRRPGSNNSWILDQDNVLVHNLFSVKQFLVDKCITVFKHLLYSPNFSPCDFYLFLKVKSALERKHFQLLKR